MSTPNDDQVAQFMSIMGISDTSTAVSFLEMSGGNLEMAIGLFMEHGAGSGGGSGVSDSGVGMDDDDTAAIAAAAGADHEVRAPDPTRSIRLMDEGPVTMMGGMMGSFADPSVRMMQEMMEEQLQRSAFDDSPFGPPRRTRGAAAARDVVDAAAEAKNNDDDYDEDNYRYGDDDDDDDVEMHDSEDQKVDSDLGRSVDHRNRSLQDMFSPPTHLLHKAGGFQGARQMAKDSKRWLLVNIQKDDEFSSHALNRDVWRNDLVENLIREGFILWQERDVAPEGSKFVQRYKVEQYPHVSIIDPRTGRLLWSKEGWTQQNPMTAEAFAEIVMDFCSRHSLDRPPIAPDIMRSKGGGSAVAQAKPPFASMTEEEQLEAAVRASISDQEMQQPHYKNDSVDEEDDDDVQFLGTSAQQATTAATATVAATASLPPSQFQTWLDMALPPDGGNAKIQFRMPNGSRVVRSFDGATTPVQMIYAFVAQSLDEAHKPSQKEFMLMAGYPPRDLKSMMDKTLDECALKGETITVRWT